VHPPLALQPLLQCPELTRIEGFMAGNDQDSAPSRVRLPNLIRPNQIPAMVINTNHLSGDTLTLSVDQIVLTPPIKLRNGAVGCNTPYSAVRYRIKGMTSFQIEVPMISNKPFCKRFSENP